MNIRFIFIVAGFSLPLLLFCTSLHTMSGTDAVYTIQEIKPQQYAQAEELMNKVFGELVDKAEAGKTGGLTREKLANFLADVYQAQENYFDKGGTFLVITDGTGAVFGTGALVEFDENRAEIKRVTIAPALRGKGYGEKLVTALVDKAKELGYSSVVLDVFYPEHQGTAIRLYKRLGFVTIPPYRPCRAKNALSMEKLLTLF